MLAGTGVVLGPGRVRLWWTRLVKWLERRYAPQVLASKARLPQQEADVTRLEELVDRIWP